MATLKEQFQIKTVAAFEAADGTKFHMLSEAQSYTRNKMLSAIYKASCKAIPDVIKIDEKLFIDLCLNAGRQIGAVMAEPLAADSYDQEIAEKLRTTTSINIAGTMPQGMAEALAREQRRQADGVKITPMPRAVNPDIFKPYEEDREPQLDGLRAAMARVDANDFSDDELEGAIARELSTGS